VECDRLSGAEKSSTVDIDRDWHKTEATGWGTVWHAQGYEQREIPCQYPYFIVNCKLS
jgi:hypothetical protein